jgi:Protein of unknown function (DUF2934)
VTLKKLWSEFMRTRYPKHATAARPAATGGQAPTEPPTVASDVTPHTVREVTADDVRLRAYRRWESAGKPPGDGVQFWFEAEHELMHAD